MRPLVAPLRDIKREVDTSCITDLDLQRAALHPRIDGLSHGLTLPSGMTAYGQRTDTPTFRVRNRSGHGHGYRALGSTIGTRDVEPQIFPRLPIICLVLGTELSIGQPI